MDQLLAILADGAVHSGADIGRKLGISRAGVWKRVRLLEEKTGLELVKVAGKGYQLVQALELLDADKLRSACGLDVCLVLHELIDSTNLEAMRLLRAGKAVDLVVAEGQSGGKGRRGREWASPYGSNVYISYVWPVTSAVRQLEGLSLVVGLAVVSVLRDLDVQSVGLKWPNDVLVEGKKIAGILLELIGDPADQGFVIIGIGINANAVQLGVDVGQPWTSIYRETGSMVSRNELVGMLFTRLKAMLAIHLQAGFAAFESDWEQAQVWVNDVVELSIGDRCIRGRYIGVNERGELGLEIGSETCFYAGGELSLSLADDTRD